MDLQQPSKSLVQRSKSRYRSESLPLLSMLMLEHQLGVALLVDIIIVGQVVTRMAPDRINVGTNMQKFQNLHC